jgi:hypothetical protein
MSGWQCTIELKAGTKKQRHEATDLKIELPMYFVSEIVDGLREVVPRDAGRLVLCELRRSAVRLPYQIRGAPDLEDDAEKVAAT